MSRLSAINIHDLLTVTQNNPFYSGHTVYTFWVDVSRLSALNVHNLLTITQNNPFYSGHTVYTFWVEVSRLSAINVHDLLTITQNVPVYFAVYKNPLFQEETSCFTPNQKTIQIKQFVVNSSGGFLHSC